MPCSVFHTQYCSLSTENRSFTLLHHVEYSAPEKSPTRFGPVGGNSDAAPHGYYYSPRECGTIVCAATEYEEGLRPYTVFESRLSKGDQVF